MSTTSSTGGRSIHHPVHSPREIRDKVIRFRILIIGRANAGKTTILKKLCDETEDPAIFDPATRTFIKLSALDPSDGRGEHNINHAMVFKSNPDFVFHDSRGFEAGTETELRDVREFLKARNHTTRLQDRVHAIWYCIPLDDDRPIQRPEIEFFETCGTGEIPVIAVFTKLDALDDKAFDALIDEDFSHAEALAMMPKRSQQMFDQLLPKLRIFRAGFRPRSYTGLRDMDKPETNCLDLLERTAAALDDETLQLMFIAVQRSILNQCTCYAFERLLVKTHNFEKTNHMTVKDVQTAVFTYYPQLIEDLMQDEDVGSKPSDLKLQRLRRLIMDHRHEKWNDLKPWRELRVAKIRETESIQAKLGELLHGTSRLSGIHLAEFAIALAIIADQSYFLEQQNWQLEFQNSIEIAIEDFRDSSRFAESSRATHVLLEEFWARARELPQKMRADSETKELAKAMAQIVIDYRLEPAE